MKKITLGVLLVAMAFVFTGRVNAQTIIDLTEVNNVNILADTLPDLAGGEIVLLKPGKTYNSAGTFLAKSVTLQSSEPSNLNRPILYCDANFDFTDGSTIDSIIVRNLELTGEYANDYFVNATTSATVGKLKFEGCYIHSLRGIARMKGGTGTLNTYEIQNCIVNTIKDYGLLTVDINTWATTNIVLANSTITKTSGFLTSRNNSESITIEGCALNQVPAAGQRMFRWREAGLDNVTNGISISNTLWGPGWDETGTGTTAYDGFDGLGTTIWSFSNVYMTKDLDIADGKDSIVGCDNVYDGASTVLWSDPAGDVLTFADEAFVGIGNAGDQRWGIATDDGGVEWNISNAPLNTLFTYDTTTTIAGLTIHASSAATVIVDANNKTVGDMSFTQRLKLGGSGSFDGTDVPLTRVLSVDVTHACQIVVAAMSSSSGSDRKLNVCAGSTDNLIDTIAAFGPALTLDTVYYTGAPTKLFLYSPSSGVNVYYMKVVDIVNTDATLSVLSVDAGDLSPAFDPAVESYTCDVPYGTTSVTVTATPTDGNASLTGDGAVDVTSGTGTATVVVTAEDGTTTKTYTVTITVLPNNDATLSALNVSLGALVPTFDPATQAYDVELPMNTTSVTVTATATDQNATIAGTGDIDVSSGSGTATVTVTAADGTTTLDYVIDFTVASEPQVTADITFIVDDSQGATYDGFQLKGSWITATGVYDANWDGGAVHTVFYDDGTHGDATSGDHIWSVTVTLVSDAGAHTWEWGFMDLQDNWIPTANQQFNITDGTAKSLDAYVIVGIENGLSGSMGVYPTISNGMYNVEFAGQPGMIKVYNLSGKLVVSQQATNAVTPVTLNNEGMYIFRLESEEGSRTVRVVTVK